MLNRSAVIRVVEQMVEDLNQGNLSGALSAFADDVLIVDDIPPFRRSGIIGAEALLKSVIRTWERLHGSFDLAGPIRCEVDTGHAYVVAPVHLSIKSSSGSGKAVGLLTFTIRGVEDSLRIDAAVWSSTG